MVRMVMMAMVMIMVVSTAMVVWYLLKHKNWRTFAKCAHEVMAKDKDFDNFQAKQKFHNKFKRPTPFFWRCPNLLIYCKHVEIQDNPRDNLQWYFCIYEHRLKGVSQSLPGFDQPFLTTGLKFSRISTGSLSESLTHKQTHRNRVLITLLDVFGCCAAMFCDVPGSYS